VAMFKHKVEFLTENPCSHFYSIMAALISKVFMLRHLFFVGYSESNVLHLLRQNSF
jgi:hypothetical protein